MNILKNLSIVTTGALLVTLGTVVKAQAFTLNFEGNGDNNPAANFYSNLGVTFTGNAVTYFDANNGPNSTVLNLPSAPTFLSFTGVNSVTNDSSVILNYAAGFTGLSFYYAAQTSPASFAVYGGTNAQSPTLVSTTSLPFTPHDGNGNLLFANNPTTVTFQGIAKSVKFTGGSGNLELDNINITPYVAPSTVPEPSSVLGIMALGTVGAVSTLKRKLTK